MSDQTRGGGEFRGRLLKLDDAPGADVGLAAAGVELAGFRGEDDAGVGGDVEGRGIVAADGVFCAVVIGEE